MKKQGTFKEKQPKGGSWLASSVQHVIFDFRVVSSSPMLGIVITSTNKQTKKQLKVLKKCSGIESHFKKTTRSIFTLRK